MLNVSCRIYDDVGRSRVYYLRRCTARMDYMMIDTAKKEKRKVAQCSLREITLAKTELKFLIKAYFRYGATV